MADRSVAAEVASERGSGTVLGLAVIAVGLVLVLTVAALGGGLQARAAVQTAADLGAIAGAEELHRPDGSPAAACARAREVVVRGGAAMDGCQVTDGDVEVRASVTTTWSLTARAVARAGPTGRRRDGAGSVRAGGEEEPQQPHRAGLVER